MTALKTALAELSDAADAVGVGLSLEAPGDFVWISEIHRNARAARGEGRAWIDKTRRLAALHGLPVRLCCTSWNTGLVDYYTRQGFASLYCEGEEVFLEAPVPDLA